VSKIKANSISTRNAFKPDIPKMSGFLFFCTSDFFPKDLGMPSRAKSICRHPGCGRLIDAPGYCSKHAQEPALRKAKVDRHRLTPHQRGYNYQWRQARRVFLMEHPLCVACERNGRLTAAQVVDHREPHQGDQERFWNRSNWQPLCVRCHNAKTASQDGGFGNPIVR